MNLTVSTDIDRLTSAVNQYVRLSGKTLQEALQKQGGKLAFNLRTGFRGLAPAKGSIRSTRLAALAAGGGIKVRASAWQWATEQVAGRQTTRRKRRSGGKRQLGKSALAVKRELSIRESGRGFVSVSARFPLTLGASQVARSKFGPVLSSAIIESADRNAKLTLSWDPSRGHLAEGVAAALGNPRAETILADAVKATTADIQVYLNRKLGEHIDKAGMK